MSAYVFMQTFSIPGSTFCSILAGFMWPWYQALPLICIASGTGASLCFLLSKIVGQPLVKRFAPERAEQWKQKVNENKDDLFNYILFLRITPFLPNWFINLTGPLVGVPLSPFFWGSVIGKLLNYSSSPPKLFPRCGSTFNVGSTSWSGS